MWIKLSFSFLGSFLFLFTHAHQQSSPNSFYSMGRGCSSCDPCLQSVSSQSRQMLLCQSHSERTDGSPCGIIIIGSAEGEASSLHRILAMEVELEDLGALVNALGAILLGAPVGNQHFKRTVNWSLLMSVFTVVPAASVFGSSWTDWHRVLAHTKSMGPVDYIICLPAYGAVIGAWFGAWPMPLDWERLWQERPICVTYGAILGYLMGVIASFGLVVYYNRQHHGKRD